MLQEIIAEPIEVVMDFYHSCPLLGCRKKMKENSKAKHYSCDICKKLYIVSATGVCAKILVTQNKLVKTFTLFNENAERFFGRVCKDMLSECLTSETLLELVKDEYLFTVTGGKKENEFLVTKCKRLGTHKKTEIPQIQEKYNVTSLEKALHLFPPHL